MVVLFGLADLLQAAFVQFGRGKMLRIVLCGRCFGAQVPHGQLGKIGLAGLLQGGIEVLRQCAAFQQFGADGIRLRQAVLRGVLQGSLAQFQAAFQRFFGVVAEPRIDAVGDELCRYAQQKQRGQHGDKGKHAAEFAGDLRAENLVVFIAQNQPDIARYHDEQGKCQHGRRAGNPPEIRGETALAVGGESEQVEHGEGGDAAENQETAHDRRMWGIRF